MLVKDIMSKKVFTVEPETSLREAISIMCDNNIGCVVVTKNNKVRGIVTERDIMKCIVQKTIEYADEIKVSSIMTHFIISVKPEEKVEKAIELLRKHNIKKLPVLDDSGKLEGIITTTDIVLVETKMIEKLSEIFSKEIKDI